MLSCPAACYPSCPSLNRRFQSDLTQRRANCFIFPAPEQGRWNHDEVGYGKTDSEVKALCLKRSISRWVYRRLECTLRHSDTVSSSLDREARVTSTTSLDRHGDRSFSLLYASWTDSDHRTIHANATRGCPPGELGAHLLV